MGVARRTASFLGIKNLNTPVVLFCVASQFVLISVALLVYVDILNLFSESEPVFNQLAEFNTTTAISLPLSPKNNTVTSSTALKVKHMTSMNDSSSARVSHNSEWLVDDWFDVWRESDRGGERLRLVVAGAAHAGTTSIHALLWAQCGRDFLVSDQTMENWHWHNCIPPGFKNSLLSVAEFEDTLSNLEKRDSSWQMSARIEKWVDLSHESWIKRKTGSKSKKKSGTDMNGQFHWRPSAQFAEWSQIKGNKEWRTVVSAANRNQRQSGSRRTVKFRTAANSQKSKGNRPNQKAKSKHAHGGDVEKKYTREKTTTTDAYNSEESKNTTETKSESDLTESVSESGSDIVVVASDKFSRTETGSRSQQIRDKFNRQHKERLHAMEDRLISHRRNGADTKNAANPKADTESNAIELLSISGNRTGKGLRRRLGNGKLHKMKNVYRGVQPPAGSGYRMYWKELFGLSTTKSEKTFRDNVKKDAALHKCSKEHFYDQYYFMAVARRNKLLLFDKTPGYIYKPMVPVLLHLEFPQCKVLISLRDPMARMLSQMMHFKHEGNFKTLKKMDISSRNGADFIQNAVNGRNNALPQFKFIHQLLNAKLTRIRDWQHFYPWLLSNGSGNGDFEGELKLDYWTVARQLLFCNFVCHRAYDQFKLRPYIGCYYYPLLTYMRAFDLISMDHSTKTLRLATTVESANGMQYFDNLRVIQFEAAMQRMPHTMRTVQCWAHCQSVQCGNECNGKALESEDSLLQFMAGKGLSEDRICGRNDQRETYLGNASHRNKHKFDRSVFDTDVFADARAAVFDFFLPCNAHLQRLLDTFPFLKLGEWNIGKYWAKH